MEIRKARAEDSEQLWQLMRDLAVFEKYIDSFAITPEIVRHSGFQKEPPDFYCLVAADGGVVLGMLVYYFLPYTAQNRPAIYMKELFVRDGHRNQGIGKGLMDALKTEAGKNRCAQIKWTVAPWNKPGIHFYERLGATENTEWISFEWNI